MSVNNFLQKKAFTLIELLIVIVLIGILYTLAIGSFESLKEKRSSLTLATLKEYLHDKNHTKSSAMLCLDECLECDIYVDDKKVETLDAFLDDSVRVYRYDPSYGYIAKDSGVYFNEEDVDEDICFAYKLQRNGVGDQVLVEFEDKFYDFSSYFEDVQIYDSIAEAMEIKEEMQGVVR